MQNIDDFIRSEDIISQNNFFIYFSPEKYEKLRICFHTRHY